MNKSIRSGPDEFNFKKKIKFNDFASVINNDKELNEEFCFLNQGKHAYDWYIVSFDDINPRNYLTISGKVFLQQSNLTRE
jgi:dynein heavy chain